jgi:hypothetical protein
MQPLPGGSKCTECHRLSAVVVSQFTGLLGVSGIFDIIWMIKNEQHGLFKFLTVCLLLLKVRHNW